MGPRCRTGGCARTHPVQVLFRPRPRLKSSCFSSSSSCSSRGPLLVFCARALETSAASIARSPSARLPRQRQRPAIGGLPSLEAARVRLRAAVRGSSVCLSDGVRTLDSFSIASLSIALTVVASSFVACLMPLWSVSDALRRGRCIARPARGTVAVRSARQGLAAEGRRQARTGQARASASEGEDGSQGAAPDTLAS
ncbi:unnamed protein product [Prorocentrum cordatum]|uniref:Transmembrane protein n=1 Tax=Prorocentrum cordatum TaxID=2364126 RepID=A0ABN9U301_9DINO|nr:unnamed protein product [Polarella glacialis]